MFASGGDLEHIATAADEGRVLKSAGASEV